MADGGEHPLHLVLAALVEDELDAAATQSASPGRRRGALLELDPVAQTPEGLLARVAFDLGDVRLLDAVARVGEPVGELPVVRQQERSRRVRIEPSDEALERLRDGVELDDGITAPAQARRLGAGRIELSLHEGRKHQVKRMLAAVGYPVSHLHRSRYAGLTLEGLEPGAWRELEPSEVARLRP